MESELDRRQVAEIAACYRRWLEKKFIGRNGNLEQYSMIFDALFREPFEAIVPNDENRGADGISLRGRFIDSRRGQRIAARKNVGQDGIQEAMEWLDGPNMLEVMIAICLHMEDMTRSFVEDCSASYWMERLLVNMDIADLTDDAYVSLGGDLAVHRAAAMVIDRTYDRLGCGSLFPMKDTRKNREKDFRTVEIWYQMQAWLGENVNYSSMDYADFESY